MSEPDVIARIRDFFPQLSAGQQQVARYIARNLDLCAFQSARAIGEAVGVSEATVIRTAMALNYEGFTELQQDIRQAFVGQRTLNKLSESVSNIEPSGSIFTQSIQLDIRNLQQTLETLHSEDLQHAVDYLAQADRILVIGLRSSWSIAHFLAYALQQMLGNATLLDPSGIHEPYEALRFINSYTTVVGISYPRYTRETVKLVRYSKRHNAKVIAITDTALSPLADYADITLCTEARSLFHLDSMVAACAVANALLSGLIQQQRDRVIVHLRELEKVFTEEKVFFAQTTGNASHDTVMLEK